MSGHCAGCLALAKERDELRADTKERKLFIDAQAIAIENLKAEAEERIRTQADFLTNLAKATNDANDRLRSALQEIAKQDLCGNNIRAMKDKE